MDQTPECESALRAHIRTLLLDYTLLHLTTDFVVFTEEAVAELLIGKIFPIPTADPTDLAFQSTGGQTGALVSCLNSTDLSPYEERWTMGGDILSYLRSCHSATLFEPATARCWNVCGQQACFSLRPTSPVLTVHSIQETPELGAQHVQLDRFQSLGMSKVAEQPIEEKAQIHLADALDLSLSLEAEAISAVSHLIRAIAMPRSHKGDISLFFRPESPFHIIRLDSPPIFSREPTIPSKVPDPVNADTGVANERPACTYVDLLPSLSTVTFEAEEREQESEEHMAVLGGFVSSYFSSSPAVSDCSISDVRGLLPSRNGSPYIKLLESAIIEEYEWPRTYHSPAGQPVSRTGRLKDLPKTLSQVAGSVLPPGRAYQLGSTAYELSRESSLGVEGGNNEDNTASDMDVVLQLFQARSCGTDMGIDPLELIFQEKLVDGETLFMDVPQLPLPYSSPSNRVFPPTTFPGLVSNANRTQGCTGNGYSFLRKTKGLKALNIELGWRPFNFGLRVPTHEDVVDVGAFSECPSAQTEEDRAFKDPLEPSPGPVEAFLISSLVKEYYEVYTPRSLRLTSMLDDAGEYALTEEERRWLYGYPPRVLACAHSASREAAFSGDTNIVIPDSDDFHLRVSPKKLRNGVSGMPSAPQVLVTHDFDTVLDGFTAQETIGYPIFYPTSDAQSSNCPCSDTSSKSGIEKFASMAQRPPSILHAGHGFTEECNTPLRQREGETAEDSFIPLSFDSGIPPSSRLLPLGLLSSDQPLNLGCTGEGSTKIHPYLGPENLVGQLWSHQYCGRPSLANFLELRAKTSNSNRTSLLSSVFEDSPPSANTPRIFVPEEVVDRNTLDLLMPHPTSGHQHSYLASMHIIERRLLVHTLSRSSVDLVERESLGDAHFILDMDTAAVCISLFTLPSQAELLLEAIQRMSWRFLNVLVIFEAFPISSYRSPRSDPPAINPFSPPILKAIHKFRRDISLADACSLKCSESHVQYAFALTVEQVAQCVRFFGDLAECRDSTDGVIWHYRSWLHTDKEEDELILSTIHGMNQFVACLILSQCTLEEFLSLGPEERLGFGKYVGLARMVALNHFLLQRTETMDLPSSSPTNSSDDVRP